MEPRSLEVAVLSAEDLRVRGKPVKKDTFVVVKTGPYNTKSTTADCRGGSHPSWNERLVISMPAGCRSITLEVQCRIGSNDNSRLVGSASVPVSEFLEDYTPENHLHLLSYRIRDSAGQKNGIINVSVRVIGGGGFSTGGGNYGYNSCGRSRYGCSSSSVAGWNPAVPVAVGVPVAREGGIAAGIPVWGASRALVHFY